MKPYVIKYLHSEIVSYVEENIKNNTFKEGDKLPSERSLASKFHVSRNVVREGINILREKGLITVHPGRGAFITKPDPLMITSIMESILQNYDTTLEDILEVREDLELSIITKAVRSADLPDIQKLNSLYQLMEKHKTNPELFTKYDFEFHITLARATNNKLFAILLNSFVEMTDSVLFAITRITPETIEEAQQQHLLIIQAVERKDEQLAKNVMMEHMRMLRSDIELLKEKKLY